MRTNYFTFFIVSILGFGPMQQVDAQQVYYNKALHGVASNTSDIEIKGNPYLEDGFSKYDIEGAKVENIPLLRYNHYSDQMEYLDENVLYDLNKIPNMIITFKRSNKKFIYLQYQENNGKSGGYMQILNKGKNTTLYKKEIVILADRMEKSDLLDTSGTKIQLYEADKPIYYFTIDNSIVLIPNKRKELMSIFKDEHVKNYIKKEKISSTNETDLIKLTQYINQL
ncbi:hypothetical protein ACTS9C_09825 [Empedobacter brevis]